jgi:branched-chain amino acid transport system substrate-binding protein
MKMKKFGIWLLLLLLLFVTACSQSTGQMSGGSGSGEVIKIGAIYPLSGSAALLGDESFRGFELAVKMRNSKGGVAGGKKIEIVKADAPDAKAAQSEANRLVTQENVEIITGSYSSSVSFAGSEVTERNGVLYWELGAISDKITERGYKYVVRTNPPSMAFQTQEADFLKDTVAPKLGKKVEELKIALVHEDSLYGTTSAEGFKKVAAERKLNIVTDQSYSLKSVDLSSVVLNVKKVNPDVVILTSYLNDSILFIRQAKELGLKPAAIVATGGGPSMKDFQKSLGADAEGIISVDFPQYNINKQFTPGQDDFIKLYKETYGEAPRSGHSLANFVGGNILLDAIDKAGGTNPDKVREAAMAIKVEPGKTATGWGVEFDPNTGQNKLGLPYAHQWKNGELVTVWPKEAAVQEASFAPKK